MRYLSVCSGIEAATAAWHPLGFQPAAFSEIEPFPSAVLAHHYSDVPNYGDMTKYKDWPDATIDILVGGTPCQSFSVAGLRKGLDDPRGNLTLVYLAIAAKYRPKWVVWENVPGVLSDKTGAFGAFLGGLGQLGYGFAYRILDAQYFGIPQRRRRVFVVGCLGSWQRAAAVLFERHSLSGHPAPSRKAREVAPTIPSRSTGGGGLGTDFDCDGGLIAPEISNALCARDYKGARPKADQGAPLVASSRPIAWDEELNPSIDVAGTVVRGGAGGRHDGVMTFHPTQDPIHNTDVCHALNANANATAAIAIQGAATRENPSSGPDGIGVRTDDCAYTLEARSEVQAVAWSIMPQNSGKDYKARQVDVLQPLMAAGVQHGNQGGDIIQSAMHVRRLTPRECERLQGFPDDYTQIPWRNKPADQCPDGPRYKALGNSMAVPVMRWIGERIQQVAAIPAARQVAL